MRCLLMNSIARETPRAILSTTSLNYTDGYPVAVIENFVDGVDIQHVNALSKCIQQYFPHNSKYIKEQDYYNGGINITIFDSLAAQLLPEITDHIKNSVAEMARKISWGPDPLHLSIRFVETADYSMGSDFTLHRDNHYLYSLLILLSPTQFVVRFQGNSKIVTSRVSGLPGTAVLMDGNAINFNRGVDSLVFVSDAHILAVEMWVNNGGN